MVEHEVGSMRYGRTDSGALGTARNDLIAVAAAAGAALFFVALGGPLLAAALAMNVVLFAYGLRRWSDLAHAHEARTLAEARVHALACQDSLTGLRNRAAFSSEAGRLIARSREQRRPVALLLLDLDHFKTINDVNGHAVGDAALKCAAEIIDAQLPAGALAARLGGDEFAAVFAFEAGRPESVEAVAARLVTELGRRFETGGIAVHLGASIGIARSEPDCADVEPLMRRADIAMYAAKNAGRNRFSWFDAAMEREQHMRSAVETGLREGIPLGHFVPFYEQQIDLATGRLHGFEMLARWRHPTRGIISPDVFIPVAEETGLIADLSMSVMRQAFEDAKNWDPGLTLSVNISPTQLKDPWLAQKIVKLLVETGFPASRLEVEITEGALFENLGVAQSIIGSLKNQGVRIALDDFGTGYSSLAHLRALPFDRVKIDRSFVMSVGFNSESAAIVNAITRLSDSLGLPVTAEGVETQAIEQHMKDLGCHKAQGWHFGKPMDVGQVRALLAEKNLLPAGRAVAATNVREFRRSA